MGREESAYSVHFDDSLVVGHGHVDELGDELPGSRLAHQEPDLLERVGRPREQNEQRNAHGTDRVEVPDESVADDGHDQTEQVDHDVVAVVDEEDVDRRESSVEEAVEHQGALCENCSHATKSQHTKYDTLPEGLKIYGCFLTGNTDKRQRNDL